MATKPLTSSASLPQNNVPLKDVAVETAQRFQELRIMEFGELLIKKHQNVYSFQICEKKQFVEK